MERQRILLVEDSPTQANRLRRFLEGEDLHVVHVGTAEAALDELHTSGADLVLLDFQLPGMNGDEFCREIRLNVNTRAIPVLMLTGQGDDAAQLRSLESGADDYLPKTADPDVLLVRVRSLLRKSRGAGPVMDVERRFQQARVLAIDDSPTYLYILGKELQAEHYIVETAETPERGLELVAGSSFDCVLVDYEMPGLNGAEVCRRIRDMHGDPEPELVLIMLSSHEDKARLAQGFDAGADDYIAKSADLAITKARIRALLRRKFLVEENRRILEEVQEKEVQAIRAQAAEEAVALHESMSARLAEANLELEQFASAAAHDLREPLRMVTIYSQLLQQELAASLDDTAKDYIARCVEGTQRMDRLIQDLLLYAMASKDEGRPEQPVDLDEMLTRAIDHLSGSIESSSAVIERQTLPALHVHGIRLQQVFQNLIGNAIKYSRPHHSPRIRVFAERGDGEWLFTVEDNGVGIDPQYQKAVFQPFRQLHDRESSGTGLGLAICQRIVIRLGGRIWVEPAPMGGSRFRFTLPSGE